MKSEKERQFEEFEYLFPTKQEWFSPKEVGEIIGRSDQFVRNSFHSGKIMGHQGNGCAPKGYEKRVYMLIHKTMLQLYLLETANYTSDLFMERLFAIVSRCSQFQLFKLEKFLKDILYSGRR